MKRCVGCQKQIDPDDLESTDDTCGHCLDKIIAAIAKPKVETLKPLPKKFGAAGRPGPLKGIRVGERRA